MPELTNKTYKALKRLLGKAYANELTLCLEDLSQKFEEWKAGKIDCWQLNEHIHIFHNKTARQLFNSYNNTHGLHPLYMVVRAVHLGLLQRADVPTEALIHVEHNIKAFFSSTSPQSECDTVHVSEADGPLPS
jgi:hypothetical protein